MTRAMSHPASSRHTPTILAWSVHTTNDTGPATPIDPAPAGPPPRSPILRVLENTIMNVLAAAGLVCIVLVIWAFVGNYSLIMFKTGSMSPTIPQGSLARVHQIPASEISVGDIVTVDRETGRPVTHRVTEVHPQADGHALIAMKGDANPNPDPGMYRVAEVREVVWHAPGLAKGVVWLANPYVLGTITICASLLVLWAFWPRSPRIRE
ncbi:signal peptidase I [Gordonia sp. N1V]|uniref:signal peptidase I n=1 Tax=Gordonia sp. N1V TaxID=3034163 RepID=UPI0023E1C4E6|nr:signal peptidase I [Gordonia sp. N1V]MDF3284888.1 signal peptidase I [Gordonia sp. N1V]